MEAETYLHYSDTLVLQNTQHPWAMFFKNQVYHFGLLMTGILKDVQAWSPDAYKYLAPEIQR